MTGDETGGANHRLEAIAPQLKALPPGTQVAVIEEGDTLLLYNINRAIELFGSRPPATMIDVAARASRIRPRGTEAADEQVAYIDPQHAESVDLSYPILILESRQELDGTPGRVIDGWHRIYRAAQRGLTELPAIALSPEDERHIRLDVEGEGSVPD